MRDSGRLQFMHQVGVPTRCAAGVAEVGGALGGLKCRPDHRHSEIARHLGNLWLFTIIKSAIHETQRRNLLGTGTTYMYFNLAVVLAQCQLLLRAKVLVTEENNTPFRDEQG